MKKTRLDQLVFGFGHGLDVAKGLKMLGADAGDEADGGPDQLAQLLYVAHVARAHLRHEDLMLGL